MHEPIWGTLRPNSRSGKSDLAGTLVRAAGAVARLDHALTSHPLLPAVLYRARLEAVRRAAAADGRAIQPWHLAAILEGLRLRMDASLSIEERGLIFEAARHALDQHQWLVRPDLDRESGISAAEKVLGQAAGSTPLIAGGQGFHTWIDRGGDRRAGRAALIRYWRRQGVLTSPFPLVAAKALGAEAPWRLNDWMEIFLGEIAQEAEDGLQLLQNLERAWFSARTKAAGQRSTSRASVAIDVLAAAPLLSATSLGQAIGMSTKNAGVLLDRFWESGIVVEVTHRSRRRLFGLAQLAPLRDGVAPPRRPVPGRGQGRPSVVPRPTQIEDLPALPLSIAAITPIERQSFDFSGLDAAMAFADLAIVNAQRTLASLPASIPRGSD